jgi:hypothetical protein
MACVPRRLFEGRRVVRLPGVAASPDAAAQVTF